jgi:thiamine biosynthesis protein ThiS
VITVNGNALEWTQGMTVSDALTLMGYTAPSLITVFVDGTYVPEDDYATHPVPDGAQMKALHLHHGG